MFSQVGPLEILLVLGIALLVLGPKRLPGAGRAMGQGLREFKEAVIPSRTESPLTPEPETDR
jgi:TatA/E family protein of Tat protein translocase